MPVIIDSGDNPRISLMQQGKLRGEANGDFIRETSVLENSLNVNSYGSRQKDELSVLLLLGISTVNC